MADFMEPRGAPATGHVAIDETDRLIASDKVEGTAVFGRDGERLGAESSPQRSEAPAREPGPPPPDRASSRPPRGERQ